MVSKISPVHNASTPGAGSHPGDVNLDGAILEANGGFFTRSQALSGGADDRTLRTALRTGEIVRLRHGCYAPKPAFDELDEAARHLLLARAVLASQRGKVALAGPSAALLHGFAVWGHDLSVVHLLRCDKGPGRREAGVVHHVAKKPKAVGLGTYGGVLAVRPELAVWQVARLSTLESAVVTADSALRIRPDLAGPLHELADRQRAHAHSRTARLALSLARPEAESPGESVTRVACYRYGIPSPILQYEVVDDNGEVLGRADFYWEDFRHLAEFDGQVKYERYLLPGETIHDCVLREKRREDAMRGTLRGMSRVVWAEVMPTRVRTSMSLLRRDLERSHRLYVRR